MSMVNSEIKQAIKDLARLADAAEAIAGALLLKNAAPQGEKGTLLQLIGCTDGFTDQLLSIVNSGDNGFEKAIALRQLVERGRAISRGYKADLEKLESEDGQEKGPQAEAGERQEV